MNIQNKLLLENTNIKALSEHLCKYCKSEFNIYDIEKEILDKHSFNYPDICGTCRFRILYSYINDKQLYHRKDSLDNSNIISVFSEKYPEKVIDAERYKKMMVDDYALKFGKEVGIDIFESFLNLERIVPKSSRMLYPGLENSEYSSHVGWGKNLYLSFCVFENCEDIYYSFRILGNCTTVFNCLDVSDSSVIYESRMVVNSQKIFFSSNTFECDNLLFCTNMQNSNNCILSCNQTNAQYKIMNKQYSKQGYIVAQTDIKERIKTSKGLQKIKKIYSDFLSKNLVEPSLNIQNSENISGDNIYFSSNNLNSFKGIGNNNTIHTILTGNHKGDKMTNIISSIEAGQMCENCVGCCSFGQYIYNLFFSHGISESHDCYYCIDLQQCEECMFSIGLRNKKYCILNQQYSEEEYFKLKKDFQKHKKWGNFLGIEFSPYPYNDTSSYDFFKVNTVISFSGEKIIVNKKSIGIVTILEEKFISKAVLDLGGEKIDILWRTEDKEVNVPEGTKILKDEDTYSIQQYSSELLKSAITCKKSGRPFRIIQDELDFLKKYELPLPSEHHEIRLEKLLKERPIGELHMRTCDCCKKEILSIFEGKHKYKIYCPECYKDYMYR